MFKKIITTLIIASKTNALAKMIAKVDAKFIKAKRPLRQLLPTNLQVERSLAIIEKEPYIMDFDYLFVNSWLCQQNAMK